MFVNALTKYKKWGWRGGIGLALGLALLVLPLYAFKISQKTDYTDFDVYFKSALRAKAAQWSLVYSLQDGASPFRYPPPFLLFFRPFAELGLDQAKMVWYLFQYFCFGLGFYWIYRSLRAALPSREKITALAATSFSFLFVLRFCLDTFTIGQVSGLMFLGFSFGAYHWLVRRDFLSILGVLIPTVFKIGPGFVYGAFLSARPRRQFKAGIWFSVLVASWVGICSWLLRTLGAPSLWADWMRIVELDSTYYDASHYGSQSIKSFLLRSVNSGWISMASSERLYLGVSVLICLGILGFWQFRRPMRFLGRGHFFSLGIYCYLWVMPETFKYSLTMVAIPVSFLLISPSLKAWDYFSLVFGACTLSLAGKDVVGDTLFFGNQIYSFPLFATLFLGVSTFRQAWKHSRPSQLLRFYSREIPFPKGQIGPWKTLPPGEPTRPTSVIVPLAATDPQRLKAFLTELSAQLDRTSEFLLVFYGVHWSESSPLLEQAKGWSKHLPNLRILLHKGLPARGAALRTGFLASSGKNLLLVQPEQICEPSFYTQALEKLENGFDLVRANRRDPTSRFQIPVRILPWVYGRHRLGLILNRMIRFFIPIRTDDVLSGNLGITRALALQAFAVQSTTGMLFDFELSAVATARNAREIDLPVTLQLSFEKSAGRVFREIGVLALGLPRLIRQFRRGYYSPSPAFKNITADDWGLSAGVNQGILKLAQLGIVRRVSAMANGPHLASGLRDLQKIPGVELGLHFNLTYGKPSQPFPVPCALLTPDLRFIPSPFQFLMKWLDPRNPREQLTLYVQRELQAQLSLLKQAGIQITYLDGHHHIHLVPGLLSALAPILLAEGIQQVRLPLDFKLWRTPQAPLVVLSVLARRTFMKYGFKWLPCTYPSTQLFQNPLGLRRLLTQYPHHEIIVHPAETNDLGQLQYADSYTAGRVDEYHALRMLQC